MEVVLTILIIGMVWGAVRDTYKYNVEQELYIKQAEAYRRKKEGEKNQK